MIGGAHCRQKEAFIRTIPVVAITFAALSLSTIGARADGTWCAPYRPFVGGGQHLMSVTTDDCRRGYAIYELTGVHHHRYFPERLARPG